MDQFVPNSPTCSVVGGDDSMVTYGDSQPWLAGLPHAAAIGSHFQQPFLIGLADRIARETARTERQIAHSVSKLRSEAVVIPHDILTASTDQPETIWPVVSDRGSILPYGFLWRGTKKADAQLHLPTLATLDTINWGVLRTSPVKPGLVVQTKGRGTGFLQFHEIHQDAGSFLLQAKGESFLIDPGYMPGDKVYGITAENHSVPVVDGMAPAGGEQGERSRPGLAAMIDAPWETGHQRGLTLDSTRPYGETARLSSSADTAPRRVRRVFAMNGEEGVVVLDDIVPGNGAPGAVLSRFQTARSTTWEAADGLARIFGRRSDLQITFHGPDCKVGVRGPNDFKGSWIYAAYAKAGFFSWHTLEVEYTADVNQPLLTILQPIPKGVAVRPVEVDQNAQSITIRFPSGDHLTFRNTPEGWRSDR